MAASSHTGGRPLAVSGPGARSSLACPKTASKAPRRRAYCRHDARRPHLLPRAALARCALRRPLLRRGLLDAHLLPAGLYGEAAAARELPLLSERRRCRVG